MTSGKYWFEKTPKFIMHFEFCPEPALASKEYSHFDPEFENSISLLILSLPTGLMSIHQYKTY